MIASNGPPVPGSWTFPLHEPHLRQAALPGPQPSPGEHPRRAVNADDGAIRPHQVSGRESHVARPASQVQHPHARADPCLGKDHPGSLAKRIALDLEAHQFVLTTAEPVVRVVLTHRFPPRRRQRAALAG
jgi:hypothetical protein